MNAVAVDDCLLSLAHDRRGPEDVEVAVVVVVVRVVGPFDHVAALTEDDLVLGAGVLSGGRDRLAEGAVVRLALARVRVVEAGGLERGSVCGRRKRQRQGNRREHPHQSPHADHFRPSGVQLPLVGIVRGSG